MHRALLTSMLTGDAGEPRILYASVVQGVARRDSSDARRCLDLSRPRRVPGDAVASPGRPRADRLMSDTAYRTVDPGDEPDTTGNGDPADDAYPRRPR